MDVFALSFGILAEGDRLSLAHGLEIHQGALIDDANDARHELHSLAILAIASLSKPTDAGSWLAGMLAQGISAAQVTEIVVFLGNIAALNIRRKPLAHMWHLGHLLHALAMGLRPKAAARRWPATKTGLLIACSRALLPLLVILPIVGLIWYGAGLPATGLITLVIRAVATLWLSVVLHEAAHYLPISRARNHSVVIQSGLRLGVLHRPLPPRDEFISALAGPMTGAIVAMLLAPGALGGLIALFHLASLLPTSSDGRAMLRSLPRVWA